MSNNTSNYQKITPKAIFQLTAPHTWAPASIIPVLFASVLALGNGSFSISLFYVLLFSAVFMHSAVNSLNDYYDFIRGLDTLDNSPEADDAVLVYNSFNPAKIRMVNFGLLLGSLLLGVYVVCTTNVIPLIMGVIGAATVVAYSAGQHPLSYMPLGEFTSGVVMGALLPIAVYASFSGEMYWHMFYLCLPLMLGIALIMLTNNSCDIEKDRNIGRKTLPILLGRSKACATHRVLLMAWLFSTVMITIMDFKSGLFLLPLGLFAGRQSITKLFTAKLTHTKRRYHMRDIFMANVYINGTYVVCALIASISS